MAVPGDGIAGYDDTLRVTTLETIDDLRHIHWMRAIHSGLTSE